jgi:glycosyltransferase involved in cell wall biosynthesis
MPTKMAIIVPCYNEEEILEESTLQFSNLLGELLKNGVITDDSFILFVDDGSTDSTWSIIKKQSESSNCRGIKLSTNFGHQSAILTGMESVASIVDCAVTVDADLQDDILVIKQMVELRQEGIEIVYGIRRERSSDTFFKKYSALLFYKIINILGAKTIYNHADFRLVGRKALGSLQRYKESCLFLRGIFPLMGYKTASVYYNRKERFAGESQYTLAKMFKLALDGITSFSVVPLRLIGLLGGVTVVVALGIMLYVLFSKFWGHSVEGWASMLIIVVFLGGVQLLSLGVIGEYLSRLYVEVKNRPRYIIDEMIGWSQRDIHAEKDD